MNCSRHCDRQSGFALIITLALLALLVLAVLALSALTKVNSQISSASLQQAQARQNALLGLNVAVGQLQKYAGMDGSATGIAGILSTTLPANQRWTGLWTGATTGPVWLVSGSASPTSYQPIFTFDTSSPRRILVSSSQDVALVAENTINTAASGATIYKAGEAIIVPKAPLQAYDSNGTPYTTGNYAYWVGDEGAKVSYYVPDAEAPPSGLKPRAVELATTAAQISAFPTDITAFKKVLLYEQLQKVPANPALSFLKTTYHHSTLTSRRLMPVSLGVMNQAGIININTSSENVWRILLSTYNATHASAPVAAITTKAVNIASAIPATTGRPFFSVQELESAGIITSKLSSTDPTQQQIVDYLRPILTFRSDTFRVRAYGSAVNPADATKIEAAAYCEAIAQRIDNPGTGRKFVITYFRWLGPDDI